jgi:hypothetical protein
VQCQILVDKLPSAISVLDSTIHLLHHARWLLWFFRFHPRREKLEVLLSIPHHPHHEKLKILLSILCHIVPIQLMLLVSIQLPSACVLASSFLHEAQNPATQARADVPCYFFGRL